MASRAASMGGLFSKKKPSPPESRVTEQDRAILVSEFSRCSLFIVCDYAAIAVTVDYWC